MAYNIHPLMVHFPIAFIFVYSVVKIFPFDKYFPKVLWKDLERAFLFVGILGAFAALLTGEGAQHLVRSNHKLVDMHSFFATAAVWIYGAILLGEILSIITPWINQRLRLPIVLKIIFFLRNLLTDRFFSKILAILGLITISLTGLLGGVIVYGTSSDPLAGVILKILGISL